MNKWMIWVVSHIFGNTHIYRIRRVDPLEGPGRYIMVHLPLRPMDLLPWNLRNPSIPLELVLAPEGSTEAWGCFVGHGCVGTR